jgi:hypothetical protein
MAGPAGVLGGMTAEPVTHSVSTVPYQSIPVARRHHPYRSYGVYNGLSPCAPSCPSEEFRLRFEGSISVDGSTIVVVNSRAGHSPIGHRPTLSDAVVLAVCVLLMKFHRATLGNARLPALHPTKSLRRAHRVAGQRP